MSEPQEQKAETAASAAAPSAAPTVVSPAADHPSQLQPPQVWTDLVVPEDDNDSALGEDTASSTESIASSILHYRMLNGRTYHRDNGDNHYWGPNDDRQNNTLDIGHHTYTVLMGGKLQLAPLPDNIEKVIDIGTGTGSWAIDFADEHPNAKVIGTDLSPIQPSWVPPNVSFQIDDFTEPWTFQENAFDYVHFRWLCGCVEDWTKLFKEAYKVLKPGGFIETMDFDAGVTSDDGTATEKSAISQWGHIFQEGVRKLGSRASFNPVQENLQRTALEAAGFVGITEKRYKLPTSEWSEDPLLHEVGQFTRVTITSDTEGFISMMATQLGWTPLEITVYAAHLRRELRSHKVHAYFRGGVVYAQKPLDA